MVFQNWLRNVRAFFGLVAQMYRIWFTPYHYDGDDEEVQEAAGGRAADASSQAVAAQPEPVHEAASAESAVAVESPPAHSRLTNLLAFRGAMGKRALAAALGQSAEQLEEDLTSLLETQIAEDAGSGRYLLADSERRSRLRADPNVADWLARLQRSDLEDDALAVLGHLCRHLPVKIKAGNKLVIHLRRSEWMIWESQPELCRVKIFGTLRSRHLAQVRKVDRRPRWFRVRRPHDWHVRDWVAFRWQAGAEISAIESLLVEAGENFLQRAPIRGRSGGRREQAPQQADSQPTEQEPLI